MISIAYTDFGVIGISEGFGFLDNAHYINNEQHFRLTFPPIGINLVRLVQIFTLGHTLSYITILSVNIAYSGFWIQFYMINVQIPADYIHR